MGIYKSYYWKDGQPDFNLYRQIPQHYEMHDGEVFSAWFHYYACEIEADDYERPIYDFSKILSDWEICTADTLTNLRYGEASLVDDANVLQNVAIAALKCAPTLEPWIKTILHMMTETLPSPDDLIQILETLANEKSSLYEEIVDAIYQSMADYNESKDEREERVRNIVEEYYDLDEYELLNVPSTLGENKYLLKRVVAAYDDVPCEGDGMFYDPELRQTPDKYMNVELDFYQLQYELGFSEEATDAVWNYCGSDYVEIEEVKRHFHECSYKTFLTALASAIEAGFIGEASEYHWKKDSIYTALRYARSDELFDFIHEDLYFEAPAKAYWKSFGGDDECGYHFEAFITSDSVVVCETGDKDLLVLQ